MATHSSSILAWKLPLTDKPGALQSMGLQKESDTTQQLNHSSKYQRMHRKRSCLLYVISFYLHIYFWLSQVFIAVHGLSLASGMVAALSLVAAHGLLIAAASLLVALQGAHWSVVAAPGLQSVGSVIVMDKLSCSEACGIFPDQGSNLCPLAGGILIHCHTGEIFLFVN